MNKKHTVGKECQVVDPSPHFAGGGASKKFSIFAVSQSIVNGLVSFSESHPLDFF